MTIYIELIATLSVVLCILNSSTSQTTEAPIKAKEAILKSSKECDQTGNCCFMYTWPGPKYDNGATNFDCISSGHSRPGRNSEPCKPPIVFTFQNETSEGKKEARRPNITELIKFTDENNYKIYCRKGSTCVKYSFFLTNSDGSLTVWNETRYCGIVSKIPKGSIATDECFKQQILGYTKEVCVCQGDRCNLTANLISTSSLFLLSLTIIITTAFASAFLY